MKILIVDDEALSRTTLRQKLVSYGYTDCREAANGAEACALLDADCPELIIADIRMPDLDGIELLQRVRAKGLDLLYILLSGFELFAYAQQALRQNAFAYLLKPVDDAELLAILRSAEEALARRRLLQQQESERQQLLRQGETAMRQSFLSDLVFQRKTGRRYIAAKRRALLPQLPHEGFCIAVFRVYQPKMDDPYMMDLGSLLYGVENIAGELLAGKGIVSYGFLEQNDLILLCNLQPAAWSDPCALTEAFHEVKHTCRRYLHPNLLVGLGFVTSRFEALYASYANALRVVERQVAELDRQQAVQKESDAEPLFSAEQAELLSKNLVLPDREAVAKQLADLYATYYFAGGDAARKSELHNVSLQILLLLLRVLEENLIGSERLGDEFSLYQEVASIPDAQRVQAWMGQKADECMDALVEHRREGEQALMMQARTYIHQHFGEALTLEQVAGQVHLSPNYFSRLFREQTGETFIRYVILYRIKEAKRLLLDSRYKVHEIGALVGFRDMKHFYKVFKKNTGYTPSAYRDCFRA